MTSLDNMNMVGTKSTKFENLVLKIKSCKIKFKRSTVLLI